GRCGHCLSPIFGAHVLHAMEEGPASASVSVRREWWWIFDPRCSLRAYAALMVGFGTLALTLLLSWMTGIFFRRAMDPQVGTALETMAYQTSDRLDRAIYERYRTLQLGAGLAVIKDPTAPAAERRRALES